MTESTPKTLEEHIAKARNMALWYSRPQLLPPEPRPQRLGGHRQGHRPTGPYPRLRLLSLTGAHRRSRAGSQVHLPLLPPQAGHRRQRPLHLRPLRRDPATRTPTGWRRRRSAARTAPWPPITVYGADLVPRHHPHPHLSEPATASPTTSWTWTRTSEAAAQGHGMEPRRAAHAHPGHRRPHRGQPQRRGVGQHPEESRCRGLSRELWGSRHECFRAVPVDRVSAR